MKLTVYFRPEDDGWLAVIPRLIGAAHSEATKEAALSRVQCTALRLVAREIERGRITKEEARTIEFELSEELLSVAELAALSPRPAALAPGKAAAKPQGV